MQTKLEKMEAAKDPKVETPTSAYSAYAEKLLKDLSLKDTDPVAYACALPGHQTPAPETETEQACVPNTTTTEGRLVEPRTKRI